MSVGEAIQNRLVNGGVIAAAAVLSLWWLYGSFNSFQKQSSETSAHASLSAERDVSPPVKVNISEITRAHLFGKQPETPVVKEEKKKPVVQSAPQTRLNIKLIGLMGSDNDQLARAMLTVNNKNTVLVKVGDQLEGTDASIHKIDLQQVLIDRGGVLESVKFVERQKRIDSLALNDPNRKETISFDQINTENAAGSSRGVSRQQALPVNRLPQLDNFEPPGMPEQADFQPYPDNYNDEFYQDQNIPNIPPPRGFQDPLGQGFVEDPFIDGAFEDEFDPEFYEQYNQPQQY